VGEGTAVVALDAEPPSVTAWWPLSSCLPLGALATAPPCARLHARAVLAEWGLGSVSEAAELIVSELVTNAVRISADAQRQHGGEAGVPVVIVRLAAGWDRVLVEVWDSFAGGPLIAAAWTTRAAGDFCWSRRYATGGAGAPCGAGLARSCGRNCAIDSQAWVATIEVFTCLRYRPTLPGSAEYGQQHA
jgi:hypothetical protein